MKVSWSRSLTIAIAACAALGATALPSSAGRSADSRTFADPAGDSGAAADITRVQVSNSNQGLVTFEITLANRPPVGDDDYVLVALDTDRDRGTGDGSGMDFGLQYTGDGGGAVFRWNGSAFVPTAASSFRWFVHDAVIFSINQAQLGDTPHFSFYGAAGLQSARETFDVIPDGDELAEYVVDLPLLLQQFSVTPRTPRAGRPIEARMTVRTNTTRGTVRCRATAGGRPVRGRGRWFSVISVPGPGTQAATDIRAILSCDWSVPKTAKGKRFVGTISATNDGVTLTRRVSALVR